MPVLVAVKNFSNVDTKFWFCSILLDHSTLLQMFCPDFHIPNISDVRSGYFTFKLCSKWVSIFSLICFYWSGIWCEMFREINLRNMKIKKSSKPILSENSVHLDFWIKKYFTLIIKRSTKFLLHFWGFLKYSMEYKHMVVNWDTFLFHCYFALLLF